VVALLTGLCIAAPLVSPFGSEAPPAEKPDAAYQKFLEKGRLREFPGRPWGQAFVRDSRCYQVRTNTSLEVAEYVGVLMDAINYHYCRLFRVRSVRRANINVFRTHGEMAAWAREHCKYAVKKKTLGFFSTREGGTICVVWKQLLGQHPQTVLMHEGTHQFVSSVWGSRTLPVWLNEGFAVYFENSKFDGRNLDIGRIPAARLRRLQTQMKAGKHVTLEKLFDAERKNFSVDCYGSAWAFVYWLAHSAEGQRRKLHEICLQKYVQDCRRKHRDGRRLAVYLGVSMKDLEKQWQQWVLQLDPKDPHGGTRKSEDDREEKRGAGTGKAREAAAGR
jgi:hypothetical protein